MSIARTSLSALGCSLLALSGEATAQTLNFGTPCAGAAGPTPQITVPTIPHSGQDFVIRVVGPANTAGLLFIGLSDTTSAFGALPLDLGFLGLTGCSLLVSTNLTIDFVTDQFGIFRATGIGPPAGVTAFAQAYVADIDVGLGILGGLTDGIAITGAGTPAPGDVIITEVMQNPASVLDVDGEWFEIHNLSKEAINVENWRIIDNGGVLHTIDVGGQGLIIQPGSFLVSCRNGTLAENGGVDADYVHGDDITIGNATDFLTLMDYTGAAIDTVAWDNGATFPDPTGASMSLDPASFDPLANDNGGNWCEGSTIFFVGNPDLGSPGTGNPSCP